MHVSLVVLVDVVVVLAVLTAVDMHVGLISLVDDDVIAPPRLDIDVGIIPLMDADAVSRAMILHAAVLVFLVPSAADVYHSGGACTHLLPDIEHGCECEGRRREQG